MVGQNYKNVCAFLCYRDKVFTTEEVAEFLTRHTIEEIDGKKNITGNPESFDDLLLFTIF